MEAAYCGKNNSAHQIVHVIPYNFQALSQVNWGHGTEFWHRPHHHYLLPLSLLFLFLATWTLRRPHHRCRCAPPIPISTHLYLPKAAVAPCRHLAQGQLEVPQLMPQPGTVGIVTTLHLSPSWAGMPRGCGLRVALSSKWLALHPLLRFVPSQYDLLCSCPVPPGSHFHIKVHSHSLPCLRIWGMPCVLMVTPQDGGALGSWVPK